MTRMPPRAMTRMRNGFGFEEGFSGGLDKKLLGAAVGADFDHERGGNKRNYYV